MTPSRQMRALEAGTASFLDVVGTAVSRSVAGKLGRTIATDGGNATARGDADDPLDRAALLTVLAVWVVVMGTLRLRAALRFADRSRRVPITTTQTASTVSSAARPRSGRRRAKVPAATPTTPSTARCQGCPRTTSNASNPSRTA